MLFKVILSLFFCVVAQAQSWSVIPLGVGFRFDRSEDQDLKAHTTFHLAALIEVENFSFELSRDQFSSKTSEGNVSISRRYEDYLGWASYRILGTDLWRLFVGGGFGFYQEEVTTRIGGFDSESTSQQEFFSGGGAELRWYPLSSGLVISSAVKMLYSQNFDPELQPHVLLRLGWKF